MACFGVLFAKKQRGEKNHLQLTTERSPVQSGKVGVYWEFSYFCCDKETGNVEKIEAGQSIPPRGKKVLLLEVTCREEKEEASTDETIAKEKIRGREETDA